jgi:effector-binding domain-containing protein
MTARDGGRKRNRPDDAVELVSLRPQPTAVVRAHVPMDGIPEFLGSAFAEVLQVLDEQDLAPAGPPFGRWEPRANGFDAEAGFPSTGGVSPAGRVRPQMLPEGLAASAVHHGDYAAVGETYGLLERWLAENGYVVTGQPWECYLDDPDTPEPRTQVYLPCAPALRD